MRASIQIYADLHMLGEVATNLIAPSLEAEAPVSVEFDSDDDLFGLYLTVLPHSGGMKRLRFRIFQDWLDDGAPYRADIRFEFTPVDAEAFAGELKAWCIEPNYAFMWKAD